MDISKILKEKRKELNLTQDELAIKIFVSRQTISNWETGRTLPDISSLIQISYVYNISLDNLLKGDQKIMNKIKNDNTELHSLRNTAKKKRYIIFSGIFFSLLVSCTLWVLYLFKYDPNIGALPLLGCFFSGAIGIIFSTTINKSWLRWLFILLNLIIFLSFPTLFFITTIFGF